MLYARAGVCACALLQVKHVKCTYAYITCTVRMHTCRYNNF